MRTLSRIAILAVLAGVLAAPIAEARTRVFVRIGPPAVIVEPRPVAPAGYYAWQPGYYNWDNNNYVWVHGAWVRPPHRHARWESGRWVRERRGYYWTGGRWR